MPHLFTKTAIALTAALMLATPANTGPKSFNYTPTGDAISIPQPSVSDLREKFNTGKAKIWDAACCKTCRKGKACGDSCISRTKTCRKGVGCACDGYKPAIETRERDTGDIKVVTG